MKHLGNAGMAACGESYLLNADTTQDVLQTTCLRCLFIVWGNMIAQLDTVAARVKHVVEQGAVRVINVEGKS